MKKSNWKEEVQFENDHLLVWKTRITQDSPLSLEGPSQAILSHQGGSLHHVDANGQTHKLSLHPYQPHTPTEPRLYLCYTPIDVIVMQTKSPKNTLLPSRPLD